MRPIGAEPSVGRLRRAIKRVIERIERHAGIRVEAKDGLIGAGDAGPVPPQSAQHVVRVERPPVRESLSDLKLDAVIHPLGWRLRRERGAERERTSAEARVVHTARKASIAHSLNRAIDPFVHVANTD